MVSTRSMRSNAEKRGASDDLVSLPSTKRVKKSGSSAPNPKLSSLPQWTRNESVRHSSPPSAISSARDSSVESGTDDEDAYDADVEAYTRNEETEDKVTEDEVIEDEVTEDKDTVYSDTEDTEADQLLDRIQTGIAYTQRQQALGEPIMQATRFQLDNTNDSTREALALLRRYGTLIASSPSFELFEVGIPRPDWVDEGDVSGIHDPQWWVGKSKKEVKAGPHADEADVRRAAGHLKGLKTRQNKKKGLTAREKENQWKLNAAMKAQKKNSSVEHDDDDDDDEEEKEGEDMTEGEVDGGESAPSS